MFFAKTPASSGITWFAVPFLPATPPTGTAPLRSVPCCELLICLCDRLVCWREKATFPLCLALPRPPLGAGLHDVPLAAMSFDISYILVRESKKINLFFFLITWLSF